MNFDKIREREIRRGRPGQPYGSTGWLTPSGLITPMLTFEDHLAAEAQEERSRAAAAKPRVRVKMGRAVSPSHSETP